MNIKVEQKLKKNRQLAILVGIAVLIICVIFGIQIIKYNKKNAEDEIRLQRLEEQLEYQMGRQEQLDDKESYVQTIEYIEEKAKSIGYIYPDEIIFRKED